MKVVNATGIKVDIARVSPLVGKIFCVFKNKRPKPIGKHTHDGHHFYEIFESELVMV
jgi:hypothetical protein